MGATAASNGAAEAARKVLRTGLTSVGQTAQATASCFVPGASGSLVVLAGPSVYNHLGLALLSTVSGMDPDSRVPLLLCSQHPRDPDVENQCWSL